MAGGSAAAHDYRGLVAGELAVPVDPRVQAMAKAIADAHGDASRAVLFYGSCLRETRLAGLMLDFYLIVSSYADAYGRGWFSLANRLLPPNVFPFEHGGLAAKYAVLSQADFARLCGLDADNASVWARFAQPSRLVWTRDEAAREQAVAAVAMAAPTLFTLTLPMIEAEARGVLAIWQAGFALTYAAELRAERKDRAGTIVDFDPARYERFGHALLALRLEAATPALSRAAAGRIWRRLQRRGKALTLLRLAKASTTFAGGIDYLAWKINRHAGSKIEIRPWQRRHPIIGALTLLPRLLRAGAVR